MMWWSKKNNSDRETLEAVYPDWASIVGCGRRGDLTVPFRKWLSKQDPDYQYLINETDSPKVIRQAICLFQIETEG